MNNLEIFYNIYLESINIINNMYPKDEYFINEKEILSYRKRTLKDLNKLTDNLDLLVNCFYSKDAKIISRMTTKVYENFMLAGNRKNSLINFYFNNIYNIKDEIITKVKNNCYHADLVMRNASSIIKIDASSINEILFIMNKDMISNMENLKYIEILNKNLNTTIYGIESNLVNYLESIKNEDSDEISIVGINEFNALMIEIKDNFISTTEIQSDGNEFKIIFLSSNDENDKTKKLQLN